MKAREVIHAIGKGAILGAIGIGLPAKLLKSSGIVFRTKTAQSVTSAFFTSHFSQAILQV